jgi:hypothetical protein
MTIREHWDRVADLGCILSGAQSPTLHHCHGGSLREIGIHKGLGQKTSDFLVIPLAPRFHTGEYGIDVIPVWEWEHRFGRQVDHLDELCQSLGYNVWELAGVKRRVEGC